METGRDRARPLQRSIRSIRRIYEKHETLSRLRFHGCDPGALTVKRIPVARYVCYDCGYLENWVENRYERDEIKRVWG